MCLKNTPQTYGAIAKTLHWVMALIIVGLLAAGLVMTGMENSPDKFKIYGLHKSFGVVVLMLACFRLGWKILDVSPLLPSSMSRLSKLAAKGVHGVLYMLMLFLPISGWAMSSAKGFPVSVFGIFSLPDFVVVDKKFGGDLAELHEFFAWVLMAIIALHVAGALLHHFYYKDNILRRMLPFTKRTLYALDSDTNTGC